MSTLIQNGIPIFTDIDGDPLEDGYIYIGQPGLNPLSNPLQAYWDAALTIPAGNDPTARTKGGAAAYNGVPSRLYVPTNYSITIKDKKGQIVYTVSDANDYTTPVVYVESVSALGTLTGTKDGQVVKVKGYYAGVPLDMPDYHVKPFSVKTPNGGSVIARPEGGNFEWPDISEINIKHFGCKGDNSTLDSERFQAAVNHAGEFGSIYIPEGTYIIGDITSDAVNMRSDGGVLKAAAGATAVLILSTSGYWEFIELKGFTIDGNSKSSYGITFPDAGGGRYVLNDLYIVNCSRGFYKPYGNIGNHLINVSFAYCDYGIFIRSQQAPLIMHGGADLLEQCHFGFCDLAGVYIDSPASGTGQYVMDSCIFEQNPGFAIFVEYFEGAGNPYEMRNVWFEANHTAGSVTIEGTPYTPKDMYLKNVSRGSIWGSVIESLYIEQSDITLTYGRTFGTYDFECVNSRIQFYSCYLFDGMSFTNCYVASYDSDIGGSLIEKDINIITAKEAREGSLFATYGIIGKTFDKTVEGGTYIESYDGNRDNLILNADFAGNTFSSSLTLSALQGNRIDAYPFTAVANQLYYIRCEIKLVSSVVPNCYIQGTGSVIPNDFGDLLVEGEWVTVNLFGRATNNGSVNIWCEANAGDIELAFGACTIVQVDSITDIVKFINKNTHLVKTVRSEYFDSSVGANLVNSKIGDIIWNTSPTASGNIGWVCITAGSPGTWKSFGTISP